MLLTLPTVLLRLPISLTILAHSSATLMAILPHVTLPIALAIGAQVRLALPAILPHVPIPIALAIELTLRPLLPIADANELNLLVDWLQGRSQRDNSKVGTLRKPT